MNQREKIGFTLHKRRLSLGLSLNAVSRELYGSRYRVNWLSEVEAGQKDLQLSSLIVLCKFYKLKLEIK